MATYSKKITKDGIIRYSIQAKIKNGFTGKSKFMCTTWKNDDKLVGIRAERVPMLMAKHGKKN